VEGSPRIALKQKWMKRAEKVKECVIAVQGEAAAGVGVKAFLFVATLHRSFFDVNFS